ncbi:DMT family transporter [Oceanotoga teriensis]|uniref:DMT family transporter n=1 Tax=Oceanotoga teriensis TaxID=515440 RepID=UPI0027134FE1|nr:DMT family transporter [Oceanotoga teriensis]MDO7977048.1 DMT family transporter [Oceanotoga teriensis]
MKNKGILMTMLSAILFGFMPIFAKIAYLGGINYYSLVFLRSMFALIFISIFILIKKISIKINFKDFINLFFLSLIGYTLTQLTLFASYTYISTGVATTLHFIYPVCIMTANILFFKEGINKNKVFALILAIIGISMLSINKNIKIDIRGVFIAIISGILYSYYMLVIEHTKIKNMNSVVMTFYLLLFSMIFLGFGSLKFELNFNFNYLSWFMGMIIALLCSIFAVILLQMGIKEIGSSTASILSAFEPIVSVILGVIIFRESITINIFLGIVFVIVSVLIVNFNKKH